MKIVTREEMQELDRRTIAEHGIPGEELMRRAGMQIAEEVRRLIQASPFHDPFVQFFAGRGNNGGDVFAAALQLKDELALEILLAGSLDEVRGDASIFLQRLIEADVHVAELPDLSHWREAKDQLPPGGIMVDGLLGIGAQGEPRGPVAGAIEYIRQHARKAKILALDIPSGIDPDTGKAAGLAVSADVTLTMGLPKRGLLSPAALEYVGSVRVADLGFPSDLVDALAGDPRSEMIHHDDFFDLWPVRPRAAHKGSCGRILIIGGSRQYAGAPALAGRGALRGGAGLVTIWTPSVVASLVAGYGPELIVRGVAATETGTLSQKAWSDWGAEINRYDAICIGPGLSANSDTLRWTRQVVRNARVPVVLDADALTVLAGRTDELTRSATPLILTPHPGEFATLFGMPTEQVQSDRIAAAREAASRTESTIVLKGAHTVVTHPGARARINPTGNPGMATAGSGDVLAGLLTALVGQGMAPMDAASIAVYVHGLAGDFVAARKTEAGLIATDLVEALPDALRAMAIR